MFKPERKYYIQNGEFHESKRFDVSSIQDRQFVYEVIRMISGQPVFLNEHMERLRHSILLSAFNYPLKENYIEKLVLELINKNNKEDGNIFFCIVKTAGVYDLFIYFIAHQYPTGEDYKKGVKVCSLKAMRDKPNAKLWNSTLRKKAGSVLSNNEAYEVLLIDNKGFITEGSKSNFFFIKRESVFTPKGENILEGITRRKVIHLCKKMNIEIIESDIPFSEITSYDAVFISGTSPKILPVRKIDNYTFHTTNPVLHALMQAYDELVESSCAEASEDKVS